MQVEFLQVVAQQTKKSEGMVPKGRRHDLSSLSRQDATVKMMVLVVKATEGEEKLKFFFG